MTKQMDLKALLESRMGNIQPIEEVQQSIDAVERSIPRNLMFSEESTEFKPETKAVTATTARGLTVEEAKQFDDDMNRFIDTVLISGVDYGVIPHCNKPTLLKSGAEKIMNYLGLIARTEVVNRVEDYNIGFFSYECKVFLIDYNGVVKGEGVGICNSREGRYAKQNGYAVQNTVLKMTKKRALVDAALNVGNLSSRFTQDVEDMNLEPEQPSVGKSVEELRSNKDSSTSSPKTERPASQKQIYFLETLMGQHGTTVDAMNKYVSRQYSIDDYRKISSYQASQAGYNTVINLLKKDSFGKKRIDKVKVLDAQTWLVQLQKNGRGYSSIHTIRGVLRPAFQMAVDNDYVRKNPFSFELASVIYNDSVTREALSRENERKFLRFVKEDSHFSKYYDGIYILFNTGLRISEFVGLTFKDIDFDSMRIHVDHQLQRNNGIGYNIRETKTESGERYVPMTEEVAECFKRIITKRPTPKVEPMVDGYAGFLFLDKDEHPMVAMHWEKYFQHICEKYNNIYRVQMPKVTPHICRHTFCSRMASAGMNPKTLQYIMGHSDIGVTLNTYTHIGFEDAADEMFRITKDGGEKISKPDTDNVRDFSDYRDEASNG